MLLIFNLLFFLYPLVKSQSDCTGYETCSDCIGAPMECVWCFAENHTEARCQKQDYFKQKPSWCNLVEDPKVSIDIVSNQSFSDGTNGIPAVQITPQAVNIEARTDKILDFKISYKPAVNYPLDVYFLIDSSYTMPLEKVEEQARITYDRLVKLSNNVRFGIGSFVDKKAWPIAGPSDRAYSFKHHLKLTDDMNSFQTIISYLAANNGNNLDRQEAVLDGLMQALTCEDHVGWRNESWKIIVIFTDALYHSAGDGRLVGAFKPHDLKCHLDKNCVYTHELILDYPSVSQINFVAQAKNTKIIFVVADDVETDYKALAGVIKESTVAKLFDCSKLPQIITDAYLKLQKNLLLNVDAPSHYKITFDPPCNMKHRKCSLQHKGEKNVTVKIVLKHCPSDVEQNDMIRIKPVGLKEMVLVNVTRKCRCKCQNESRIDESKCDNGGSYECGICKCKENTYNEKCSCNGNSNEPTDQNKCKASEKDTLSCSGRGTCKCGKCIDCDKSYGDFCEFRDGEGCPRPDNQLCAGHGRCQFRKCVCEDGWTGNDCSCPVNSDDCVSPYSNKICSGNGACKCGKCKCDKTADNETYSGPFCDYCSNCADKRCTELGDYAYCNHKNDKTFCDSHHHYHDIEILRRNKTDMNSDEWQTAKLCEKNDKDGKTVLFKYKYDEYLKHLQILLQNEMEEPDKVNVWVVISSVIGSMLLLGLFTYIIWMIFDHIRITREYNKFVEEATAKGFDLTDKNPLYIDPVMNYQNPSYYKKCATDDDEE